MKAAVLRGPGEVPVYADFDDPQVPEGYELVEIVAAGIHPVVRSIATGRHYGSTGTWPLVPGVDAVARTAGGALIYTGFVRPPHGTLAERAAVPASMQLSLPPGTAPERVAAGMNPGMSSWLPLCQRQDETGALGTVLILGATGMAGLLAVQNAYALGASRVIAAGRNPGALDRAAGFGATAVALDEDRDATAAALAGALAGDAPGLVLDFVWGPPAEAAFAALGRRGLGEDHADISYVQIGALAGPEAAVPSALLRSRHIQMTGSGAGSASMAVIRAEIPVYLGLIADGRIDVPVRTFPLPAIGDAWLAAAGSGNRTVVLPNAV
jgi:NADPH:quinone reductase-like Zn-dependent oxidoreductase